MIGSGAEEVLQLARDFDKVPTKVAAGLYDAYSAAGESFRDEWQVNARGHFDGHAKNYSAAITTETRRRGLSVIETDTGPEQGGSKGQGFLGRILEFGGEHSPAYLDGLRAMPAAERRIEQLTDTTIEEALP